MHGTVRRGLHGWPIVGVATVVVLLCSAIMVPMGAEPVDQVRGVIRITARTSVALFLLAFTASSLWQLWPNAWTRWQRQNRRYLGVSFAASHGIHLAALVALYRIAPAELLYDGIAITLCAPDELKKLRAVEKLTRTTLLPGGPAERAAPQPKGQQPKKPRPPRKAGLRKAAEAKGAKLAAREPAASPEKSLDPVRAQRARDRRPRRTQRAA